MTCADHRCELPIALKSVDRARCANTDTPTLDIGAGCGQRGLGVGRDRLRDIARDPGTLQCLCDPSPAIALAPQRCGARLGKSSIVDEAGSNAAIGDGIDGRIVLADPATLAKFAAQIIGQAVSRRRVAPDIMKRERLKRCGIERAGASAGTGGCSGLRQSAVFVPQSNRNENASFRCLIQGHHVSR